MKSLLKKEKGRRPLPALAKVVMQVVVLREEARIRSSRGYLQGLTHNAAFELGKMSALDDVLKLVAEVEREEPEGDTQGQSVGA